jgi:hypothetical protein
MLFLRGEDCFPSDQGPIPCRLTSLFDPGQADVSPVNSRDKHTNFAGSIHKGLEEQKGND